jgi:hypothetical protein
MLKSTLADGVWAEFGATVLVCSCGRCWTGSMSARPWWARAPWRRSAPEAWALLIYTERTRCSHEHAAREFFIADRHPRHRRRKIIIWGGDLVFGCAPGPGHNYNNAWRHRRAGPASPWPEIVGGRRWQNSPRVDFCVAPITAWRRARREFGVGDGCSEPWTPTHTYYLG